MTVTPPLVARQTPVTERTGAQRNADALQERLESSQRWPPDHHLDERLCVYAALRESDHEELRRSKHVHARYRDEYVVDPLAEKIAGAFADLLFGEDPVFTAKADTDQPGLDDLIEANALPSELWAAEEVCVSEGEVWYRVCVDPATYDYPSVEFHSRLDTLPLFRGRSLLAVAFIAEYARDEHGTRVDRYVEIQAEGFTRNLLYRGTKDSLGVEANLDDAEETQGLRPEWNHGLPILAGRVLNKRGRDFTLGISDYRGVLDLLLALNEAQTITRQNARLAGKKRLGIDAALLDPQTGDFAALGVDIARLQQLDRGDDKAAPIVDLSVEFDAQAMIAHKTELVETILTRCDIVPQFVGTGTQSGGSDRAMSGIALRVRLLPSVNAAEGKARPWDDELPKLIQKLQLADALPTESGGFGRPWSSPSEPPAVERSDTLPQDPMEEATKHASLVAAELESRKTGIEQLHPDWDAQRVQDELDQIDKELQEFGQPKGASQAPPAFQGSGPREPQNQPTPPEGDTNA